MKNQNLLDELGRMSNRERLKAILKNSDYIFSEEFISFLKGLLEFADTTTDDPSYFERIYVGEDSSFLEEMKNEMGKQAELVKDVWNSILDFKNHHSAHVLIRESDAKIINTTADETMEELLSCGKCDELIKSHGLCNGCLSGRFPEKIVEKLQPNSKSKDQYLISNKEILWNQHFKRH